MGEADDVMATGDATGLSAGDDGVSLEAVGAGM